MNIYINRAKENWVVDRFRREFNEYNHKTSNNYFFGNKLIWLIAPWTWRKINPKYLNSNKVICTIHHIDEDKFTGNEVVEFKERDKLVDIYHSISLKTTNQLSRYTNKEIKTIPFWANQNLWYEIQNKEKLRNKYSISNNDFLVGSFQRDTEGHDLMTPKLSKGPDRFIEIVGELNNEKENLRVILAGKRRNYVIHRLDDMKIPYRYFEMTTFMQLNELYNLLNLYIVASRYEGGPQAIPECALTKTPIISTDVGIASSVLRRESIFTMSNYKDAIPDINYASKKIQEFTIPNGFSKFNEMLLEK
jgi:glycosyltransferase involved in cell wall biosynthesis